MFIKNKNCVFFIIIFLEKKNSVLNANSKSCAENYRVIIIINVILYSFYSVVCISKKYYFE